MLAENNNEAEVEDVGKHDTRGEIVKDGKQIQSDVEVQAYSC